ncbi:MAG: threonine/serine exporter family protein [Acidobacteriota bacterium]
MQITQNENTRFQEQAAEFVIKLGSALHNYGTSSERLESALRKLMARLNLEGDIFASPTGLFISIGVTEHQQTHIIRVDPGEVHLEKLALLDELSQQVINDRIHITEGVKRIDEIVNAPSRYGTVLTILSYSIASAMVCRFLDGGWREILISGFIGTLIGLTGFFVGKRHQTSFLFEPIAAAISSALAIIIAQKIMVISVYEVTLSGLIAAVPGMTMTLAMKELATRNLVAGTVRVAWAGLLFLEVAFGFAVGTQVNKLFAMPLPEIDPAGLPNWTEWLALLIAPFALSVRFQARPKDFGWIMIGCIISFGGARLGASYFAWEYSGFIGAFFACAVSNLIARFKNFPAAIVLSPALLLLVPGSIGFVSVSNFLEKNILSGVAAAFSMVMVAMSIVIGLLLANAIVPARKNI